MSIGDDCELVSSSDSGSISKDGVSKDIILAIFGPITYRSELSGDKSGYELINSDGGERTGTIVALRFIGTKRE